MKEKRAQAKQARDRQEGPSNSSSHKDISGIHGSTTKQGGQAKDNPQCDKGDAREPEAFDPKYQSLPAMRPAQPPLYKPNPSYHHEGVLLVSSANSSNFIQY